MIRRRPHHFQPFGNAIPVLGIDIINPNRNPDTLVGGLVAFRPKRCRILALPASALTALAHEYLAVAGVNAPERCGIAPVKALREPELLEPREAFDDVGHVEDRVYSFGLHSAMLASRLSPRPCSQCLDRVTAQD